jgi:glutamate dehydrogenase
VRARLGLPDGVGSMTPAELMKAILAAPVDLLWNGGIGTYVKASSESHAEVGDRASDAVRINGNELRAKVVAEGGNLGLTQRGRIEAAQSGVRLNTDAIDNSAGVDTSDHEVNIKILLGIAVADGEMTEKQRNTLLPQMTDEVAALVLRDNYFQTQALSIGQRLATRQLEEQARFMRFLEKQGQLHRAIEFLPTEEEISERKARGQGLTSPEQAVLLAYSKMWLNDELIASELPEDPWVATALARYFPSRLREQFSAYIPRHPLKREIIATHVLNSMVNRVGPTFVHRLAEITGTTAPQIVRAYLATREVFGFVPTWQEIEALDNRVPDAVQAEMVIELRGLIARATTWFLRSRRLHESTELLVKRFEPAVSALRARFEQQGGLSARAQAWIAAGVPQALAVHIDAAGSLFDALDVAEIAEATQRPLEETAAVHAGVGQRLGLDRLRQQIEVLPAESYWQGLAKLALGDDLADLQRSIALEAVGHHQDGAASVLDAWEQDNRQALERAQRLLADTREGGADLAMLSVALRELRNLV